jgi:hypothetical protein
MTQPNRGVIVAGIVVGVLLVAAVVAPIVVAIRLDSLGYNPFFMILSPHNAYVVARGRRDIEWRGLRIRVGAKFVIEDDGAVIRVRRLLPSSLLFFEPALSFHTTDDSASRHFGGVRQRCAAAADSCTVHEIVVHAGKVICLQRRSTRHPGQFEFWQCRMPSGIEMVQFGTPAQCVEQNQIALAAFSSGDASPINP